jgi:hypothetical protein
VFIAATVYLNIVAAHGNLTASVMHAAMPVLFIALVEGFRHLTGLAAGTRIERIPMSRWLLAPRPTTLLARRMILWHVTSYRDRLALQYEHLAAVSRLQDQHGRRRWRAPLSDRGTRRLDLRLSRIRCAYQRLGLELDALEEDERCLPQPPRLGCRCTTSNGNSFDYLPRRELSAA